MKTLGRLLSPLLAAGIVALLAAASAPAKMPHQIGRIRVEARLFSQIVPLDPADAGGVGPGQQGRHDTNCGPFGEAGRGLFDKDISCDSAFAPDNENAIAVHPTNPNLVLGGSNDYQITFLGNTSNLQVPSGFFLSQDGGGTWIDGELPLKGSLGGGDPVPEFNLKYNQAVFASLSFVCGQFAPVCSRGNIQFASFDLDKLTGSSSDNVTWSDKTIANGNSADPAAQQIFLDKEWIAVDNNPSSPNYGNMYVTFSAFRTESGVYDESPIMFVKSEDGGNRWTLPVEISGRNPRYCTFQDDPDDTADTNGPSSSQGTAEGPDDPNACDQDQFSIPVVAPNGDLYIHFHNEQNSAAYEPPQRYDSQIMIVKSTDGGDTFSGETPTAANQAGCVRQVQAAAGVSGSCIVPIHILDMEDSYDTTTHGAEGTPFPDYPINVTGRTTLTGHQFRVNSAGNLAVGSNPTATAGELPYRLWVTFADNCAGIRPGPGVTVESPGTPAFGGAVSDTNIYYAFSDDGGATWAGGDTNNGCGGAGAGGVAPGRLLAHFDRFAMSDQWFPWSDTDAAGNLHVGFMDADFADGPVRGQYGFSNTTVFATGGLPSPTTVVSSAPSNPNNSLFFRAGAPGCVNCATFIGDYNGLAVGPDGKVHSIWTDMRRPAPSPFPARAVQDAFYASVPPPAP
jgi:hypothetical protein